jgi:hypothetical protein
MTFAFKLLCYRLQLYLHHYLEVQPKPPIIFPKICPAVLKMKHTRQIDAFQLCVHFIPLCEEYRTVRSAVTDSF